ncbi:MAG TPA: fluoride efflux transporter CrcB [Pyrinomonadaceae bacterium]|nr:fluoride efflux transporter CrcB [Pyrinomonadaceae bacterium]
MEALTKIVYVGVGGAAGAIARHLINISPLASVFERFPLPTLLINVSGSFLIGFLLYLMTDKIDVSDGLRMGVIVGFLGGFTTFSTFEMEIYGLIKTGSVGLSVVYLVLSIAAGFAALLAGVALARSL